TYSVTRGDFAGVTLGNLPAGLKMQVDNKDPWNQSSVPASVQAMVGFKGAYIKVVSNSGHAGDQAYTVQINRTFRTLPLDWGEAQDSPNGGRLVDLVTPEAGAQIYAKGKETAAGRLVTKDWAWQHVANDV